MVVPAIPSLLTYAGIAALVIWRLYSRVRRVIGRQKLSVVRPWLTVTLFPLLLAMMALAAMKQPVAIVALLAGAAIGVVLGMVGHRLTNFETTPQGLFYTPNAHLGIALSLLFAGRIAYRFMQISLAGGAPASPYGPGFVSSPVTLLIFGTLAGYYVSYAIGLLRWRRQVAATGTAAAASLET
jgi:hypothetical protein